MLGAKYSDFYRRAKIQETVFELLTQQYELAKVQEAKETPSVKVLDPGTVPEKRSFPPRLLIMFLGTVLALSLSVVCVLGSNQWQQTDLDDPRKMLAQEVAAEGIRVNAVAPGLVETGLHAANGEPGRLQRMLPTIPMKRAGLPSEVAEGVLWLLSPGASYTTGAILEIGGGR